VRADLVFLGVGGLGLHADQVIEGYWAEAVTTTCAKRVVPVHWDNFTRPLDRPLSPLPWPFDKLKRSMRVLRALAQRDGVEIIMPVAFQPIDLSTERAGAAIPSGCRE